jgi:hypothetical protein
MNHRQLPSTILALGFLLAGLAVAVLLGNSLLPIIIALVHGGVSEVRNLPVEDYIFLTPPEWLLKKDESLYGLVKVGGACLMLGFSLFTLVIAAQLWRRLVVHKLRWMTDKEVKEMSERDPGW